jgi:hypothetical protein
MIITTEGLISCLWISLIGLSVGGWLYLVNKSKLINMRKAASWLAGGILIYTLVFYTKWTLIAGWTGMAGWLTYTGVKCILRGITVANA